MPFEIIKWFNKFCEKVIKEPKSADLYIEEISKLKKRVKELELEESSLRNKHDLMKKLNTEVQVWKEKYYYLKQRQKAQKSQVNKNGNDEINLLQNNIIKLETEVDNWKNLYDEAKKLAKKLINLLRKT